MSIDVAWVSRHAMERYRLHFPEATATDLIAAVAVSLPLSAHLADALAGRRRRPGPTDGEQRLLHPAGSGVFVMCAVDDQPERMFVKTYLRLDGQEQRRMARGWFLDPVLLLRRAFELGFDAARAPDAPPLAVQASEAHINALVEMAPLLGAPAMGTVPEEETTRHIAVSADPYPEGGAAEWFALAGDVAKRVLADFASAHHGFRPDLHHWLPIGSDALLDLLAEPHIRDQEVQLGWTEPSGFAAMLVRPDSHDPEQKISVVSIPKRLRERVVGGEIAPVSDTGEAETEKIIAVPPDTAELAWANHLQVRSWGARARREAEASGLGVIPPAWLSELDPIDPNELREMLPRLGWRLGPDATYGALRAGNTVLLIRQTEGADSATVVRCTVLSHTSESEPI